jgi:hypothetical protein
MARAPQALGMSGPPKNGGEIGWFLEGNTPLKGTPSGAVTSRGRHAW